MRWGLLRFVLPGDLSAAILAKGFWLGRRLGIVLVLLLLFFLLLLPGRPSRELLPSLVDLLSLPPPSPLLGPWLCP